MATREQEVGVVDNAAASRYEMSLDGAPIGFLDYQLLGDHIILSYVEVDPAYGGRGFGGRLTEAVLEECRSRGLKVSPQCPFIAKYIRTHPEHADLVAKRH